MQQSQEVKEVYFGGLRPDQYFRSVNGNPDMLNVMAVMLVDLFMYGNTPEHQARANKAREMLEMTGVLKFSNKHSSPSLESVKELLRKIYS